MYGEAEEPDGAVSDPAKQPGRDRCEDESFAHDISFDAAPSPGLALRENPYGLLTQRGRVAG